MDIENRISSLGIGARDWSFCVMTTQSHHIMVRESTSQGIIVRSEDDQDLCRDSLSPVYTSQQWSTKDEVRI